MLFIHWIATLFFVAYDSIACVDWAVALVICRSWQHCLCTLHDYIIYLHYSEDTDCISFNRELLPRIIPGRSDIGAKCTLGFFDSHPEYGHLPLGCILHIVGFTLCWNNCIIYSSYFIICYHLLLSHFFRNLSLVFRCAYLSIALFMVFLICML